MDIPMKHEDVVAKLDAALGREAALREELGQCGSMAAMIEDKEWAEHAGTGPVSSRVESAFTQLHNELAEAQQRLTVVEQRLGDAYEWGYGDGQNAPNGYSDKEDRDKCVAELLKPAAEQEKSCPNCKVCMGSPDFPENCLINGLKS